jgi:hypothetical protein
VLLPGRAARVPASFPLKDGRSPMSALFPRRSALLRPLLLLPAIALLSACATPCERIDADMRQLNADVIRYPSMGGDGRYLSRFQELAAQAVERGCLTRDR